MISEKPPQRRGVLLVNLGSPDSPNVRDVRRYLGEFLMDGRVIDLPYFLRFLVVKGFIVPLRAGRSAAAYRSIWATTGSPLIVIGRRVREQLAERLDEPVALAMRYGKPSIEAAVRNLVATDGGLASIHVIPLYPHYAMSTFESTVAAVRDVMHRAAVGIEWTVAEPFYAYPSYIDALVDTARPLTEGDYDHLLVSYHGLPKRHLKKTDPTGAHCLHSEHCCAQESVAHQTCYRHQVFETTRLLAARLGIPRNKCSVSFQSRLGRDSWLKPFTSDEVVRLARCGVQKLVVMCPAFVADCIETLEEIGIGLRKQFLDAGGTSFGLVPCLNDHPRFIDTLAGLCSDPEMMRPERDALGAVRNRP